MQPAATRYVPREEVTAKPVARGKFRTGASTALVIDLMGQPDYQQKAKHGILVWGYKFSTVNFRDGRVVDWIDASHNLKCDGRDPDEPLVMSKDGPVLPSGFSAIILAGGGASAAPRPTGAGQSNRSRYINPNREQVTGYLRGDGTFVDGYERTVRNSTTEDNLRR